MASPSLLVGVILVIYGSNQISTVPMLPAILNVPDPTLFTIGLGALLAAVLLTLAALIFRRKQF